MSHSDPATEREARWALREKIQIAHRPTHSNLRGCGHSLGSETPAANQWWPSASQGAGALVPPENTCLTGVHRRLFSPPLVPFLSKQEAKERDEEFTNKWLTRWTVMMG